MEEDGVGGVEWQRGGGRKGGNNGGRERERERAGSLKIVEMKALG